MSTDLTCVLSHLVCACLGVENFHGVDVLTVSIRDRPVDGTDSKITHAGYEFLVHAVNDEPMISVISSFAILRPGGQTTFSINVVDDQYLNASLLLHTAMDNDDTSVRVWLLSFPGNKFTLASTLGVVYTGDGTQTLSVQGTIEDVNDALMDVQFDISASVDGLSAATSHTTGYFLVDDMGQEGFCDCDSQPHLAVAPVASCNRYAHVNHSVAVLNCAGDKVNETVTPFAWIYNERPVASTFGNRKGDGLLQRFDNVSIVDHSYPAIDDRSGWQPFTWHWGTMGLGYIQDDASCPENSAFYINSDLTGKDIRQVLTRSGFVVPSGVVAVYVRVTSDKGAALYFNDDWVGTHVHEEGCASTTVFSIPFWFAADGAVREDDSYFNQISVMSHVNMTYLDVEILVTRCKDTPDCVQRTCVTQADCGRGCVCGVPEYSGQSLYRGLTDLDQPRKDGQCLPLRCGNGIVDSALEECDDGNNIDNDACSNQCRRNQNSFCVVDRHTKDSLAAELALLRQITSPTTEQRQEIERLQAMLNSLNRGNSLANLDLGVDRFGQYCRGRCPASSTTDTKTKCQPIWSSDNTTQNPAEAYILRCNCGPTDPEPEPCQVKRLADFDPTAVGQANGIDAKGRFCSGQCPKTDQACVGEWGVSGDTEALLSCGCSGEGCKHRREGNRGYGTCQGFCPVSVSGTVGGGKVSKRNACVMSHDDGKVFGCDCPRDQGECKLAFNGKTPVCDGTCPKTKEPCALERDPATGAASCGCPPEEVKCQVDVTGRRCMGGCEDDTAAVCIPEIAIINGQRRVECQCQPTELEGCTMGINSVGVAQCSGTCKETGQKCTTATLAGHSFCECPPKPNDGPTGCNITDSGLSCKGTVKCGDKIQECTPLLFVDGRVRKCGCAGLTDPNSGCKVRGDECLGECKQTGLRCKGTYQKGRLTSCGCNPLDTQSACVKDIRVCVVKPFRSFNGGNMNEDGSFQDTVIESTSFHADLTITYQGASKQTTLKTAPEDIGIVAEALSEEELKKLDADGDSSLAGVVLTIVDMKEQQSLQVGKDDGFNFEIQFRVSSDFTGRIKRIRIRRRRTGARRAAGGDFEDVDEVCGGETKVDAEAGTVAGVACGPGTYILVELPSSTTTQPRTTTTKKATSGC